MPFYPTPDAENPQPALIWPLTVDEYPIVEHADGRLRTSHTTTRLTYRWIPAQAPDPARCNAAQGASQ